MIMPIGFSIHLFVRGIHMWYFSKSRSAVWASATGLVAAFLMFGYATAQEIADESPEADAYSASGCVYVQWCNMRGYRGTVCRVRPGCTWGDPATEVECRQDTAHVCGRPVKPWLICAGDGNNYDACYEMP
jgi:hypothetical protein